uniref:Uncharacterized protein n=1 Tax=Alexandrium catenella TaxID=2925 RepID=A0A7S1LLS8_ALECA|mmetsp:Transcript_115967/g.308441  ORF Transcript_115967/g.308441 Transcript_115967/m.308441 type:complete len:240 (+) Transcript_115967:2-721(+)
MQHLTREMKEEKGMLEAEAEALWNATGQNVTRKREELGRMVAEDEALAGAIQRPAAPKPEILQGLPVLQRFVHQGSELAQELAAEESGDAQRVGCQVFDTLCELQAPVPRCEFRYTSFVEVLSPLIKPSTLFKVLGDCPFCLKNRGSVWGLDRLWCALAADHRTESSTSCAVLDRSAVLHLNQRTLPKWRQDAADEMRAYNVLTYAEARASGSRFWVEKPETHDCVSPAQFAEGMKQQP